ncbi:MAG: hypothetical protein ACJAQ9_001460 [Ilumatobacter sp.]|jgi:hypothetical protein
MDIPLAIAATSPLSAWDNKTDCVIAWIRGRLQQFKPTRPLPPRNSTSPAEVSISLGNCLPVIVEFGKTAQKERHITGALSGAPSGAQVFCHRFSEPEAGSDVASVRTSAVSDGEHWTLTGQKMWTTLAHVAEVAIVLERTDPTPSFSQLRAASRPTAVFPRPVFSLIPRMIRFVRSPKNYGTSTVKHTKTGPKYTHGADPGEMSHRRVVSPSFDRSAFAGYRFEPEAILLAVR